MIYKVLMLAFEKDEVIREVEIPDCDLPRRKVGFGLAQNMTILELIFRYGQNDFQPRHCCSVSVGDVAILPTAEADTYWMCRPCGWWQITAEQLAEYKAMEQRERHFCDLVQGTPNGS